MVSCQCFRTCVSFGFSFIFNKYVNSFVRSLCVQVSGRSRAGFVDAGGGGINGGKLSQIKVGDVVKSINGVSTIGLSENEAVQLLRSASDRLILQLVSR